MDLVKALVRLTRPRYNFIKEIYEHDQICIEFGCGWQQEHRISIILN